MSNRLKHPVICIEIEVTEENCPAIKEILEQGQFQAKMDLVRWYDENRGDELLREKISIKIPR